MLFRVFLAVLFLVINSPATLHAEIPVYGVLTITPDTPYWRAVELGLREGANAEQVEYYVETLDRNNPTNALERCQAMLERKPNILLVALPDASALPPCFEKAQFLSIPVIAIITTDTGQHDRNISSFIQTDFSESALIGASYIANTLGKDAIGAVVIPATEKNELEIDSFVEQLQEYAPSLEVLVSAVEEVINDMPDIRAIIATDNSATLNAVSNLLEKNRDVLILSVDSKADNLALLESGRIHASVTALPYLLGKKAMEHASQTINDSGNKETVYIKPVLLTKQMLEEGNDPLLEFVK